MIKQLKSQVTGSTNKKFVFIILGCWLTMQLFLLWKNGIYTEGESEKYIYEARLLLVGKKLSSSNFNFYMVTISLIAISLKFKLGYLLPVIIQLLLNFIATCFFYKWVSVNFDRLTGIIASIVLIFFYPYQEFNSFLQTESIYFSLIIILTCYIFSVKKLNAVQLIKILILIIIICFTRPTGILFLPVVYVYLYLKFLRHYSKPRQATIIALTTIAFFISLNSIMDSGGELNFMLPFIQEHIICGVPTIKLDIKLRDSTNNNIQGICRYIINNFDQFLYLGVKRSVAFFGLKREYFSPVHNGIKISIFFFSYLLSILSIRRWMQKDVHSFVYILMTVAITWLTTVMTCDDWHNRFILAIFPMFIMLSLPATQAFGSTMKGLVRKGPSSG